MTTYALRDKFQVAEVCMKLAKVELPATVQILEGETRLQQQNRLYHKWLHEIAKQQHRVKAEVECQCKLDYGVPIKVATDIVFAGFWQRVKRVFDYEQQKKIMAWTAVSREFKIDEMVEYMNAIHSVYSEQGVKLTNPEEA